MANLALYRKYRPQDFNSVVGQETIVRILKNQIKTGRIGHAYLFSGIRGTGKTTLAKIFAKAVNCEHPVDGNPCGVCDTCKHLNEASNMDIMEIDAASNRGVDEIRSLRDTINYPPNYGKYKVYIIDEIHMLTNEAANALLKTLEEPPSHALFLLATTEPERLPATVLSRCQKYSVRPIDDKTIIDRMEEICQKEKVKITPEALTEVALRAGHSMRDALSILDQVLDLRLPDEEITQKDVDDFLGISTKEELTLIADYIAQKDSQKLVELLTQIRKQGREDKLLLEDLTEFFKDLLYFKASGTAKLGLKESFLSLKDKFDQQDLYRIIDTLLNAYNRLRFNSLSSIITDTALLSLCFDEKVKEQKKEIPKNTTVSINQKVKKEITDLEENPVELPFKSKESKTEVVQPEKIIEKEIPDNKKVENSEVKNNPIETQDNNNSSPEVNMTQLKKRLIDESEKKELFMITDVFKNSEYILNKHGLFILLDDSSEYMFKDLGFQSDLQMIVNDVFGRNVNVYPKMKRDYYSRKIKKNTSLGSEKKLKTTKSPKEALLDVIGKDVTYETQND